MHSTRALQGKGKGGKSKSKGTGEQAKGGGQDTFLASALAARLRAQGWDVPQEKGVAEGARPGERGRTQASEFSTSTSLTYCDIDDTMGALELCPVF